jgi:hypothetical protein
MSVKNVTDTMVCLAVHCRGQTGQCPLVTLSGITGETEKVCWRAMERAERHGLIEYGVSLRAAWLTNKGKQLLEPKVMQVRLSNGRILKSEGSVLKSWYLDDEEISPAEAGRILGEQLKWE